MNTQSAVRVRSRGLVLVGLLIPLAGLTVAAQATPPPTAYTGPAPTAFTMAAHSAVFDVRTLPVPASAHRPERERPEGEAPREADTPTGDLAPIGSAAGSSPAAPAPSPGVSFDGLAFNDDCSGTRCGAGHPPDTNGDVGPTYYIETVNTAIGIYNKSTGVRVAAFSFDAFMSQGAFGNLCDTDNFGDPVVLYDTFAGRWIITDFAFQLDGTGAVISPPGSYQCFAVSKSGDPVNGGWNFYSLHITDALQDYPKFGIWPDGLYMSANMFNFSGTSFQNVRVWALNRAQMEAGLTTQVVQFNAAAKTGPCPIFTLLPSNARLQTGSPPAGRENLFASVYCYTARVRIFKFHVDWANTANSTFNGPTDSTAGTTWSSPPNTVPEKDGNALDTLGIRLMMQNQYSNIAGVESLWDSHTVAGSSSSQTAVRYYQVPVTGGTIGSPLQAATYNPDSKDRWLPSVAVDSHGDMAIGYSVADASTHPQIRYAGRLAGDAVNTITQTETSLIDGTGAQVGNCGPSACERWGDYSAMTLDPDGCRFWFTSEYYADLSLNDHTRIGSFAFPSCLGSPPPTQPPPTPTPAPTPTAAQTPTAAPTPTAVPTPTAAPAPSVTSFAPTTSSPTNAASLSYALTFNESVTGLASTDFSHTGTATGCVVGSPSGSGASYTISVGSCSDGTLALTLNANTVQNAASTSGPATPSTAATVTIDRTAPSLALTAIPSGSPTNSASFSVSAVFSESVTGFTSSDVTLGGTSNTATPWTVGAVSGSGSTYSFSVTRSGPANGTLTIAVGAAKAADAAGNANTASNTLSYTIDRTAPTVTTPKTSLRSGTTLSGSSLRVAETWTGSDTGGAGIASYDVAQSTDAAAFVLIRTGFTGTWLGLIESPGHTYRYEVRAHDAAGNIGGWIAGATFHPALVQQTSTAIVYHGTWTTVSSTVYSGGSARYASAAGAYASYTFSGRSVGAVMARGPARGQVNVYVDGAFVATIDCFAATDTYRYVVFARTWSSVGTHTLKLVVVGTAGRPRVILDAIEVLG